MSLGVLATLAEESPVAYLLPLVEKWPGIALLCRSDGGVIAASASWTAEVGITPAELRLHGWRYFLADDDGVTDAEVKAMSGPDGRPAVAFRNTYTSLKGVSTLLEWHATPFLGEAGATTGTTLALARVVHPTEVKSAFSSVGIEAVISRHQHDRWSREFADESDRTFRWVARLDGEIIFSGGGGEPPGAYVGKRLGVDFGENPEFFAAVAMLLEPGAPHTMIQFAVGKEDNLPRFAGRRFANSYSLILSPSGREPIAVAVVTLDVTGAILESDGHCRVHELQCPYAAQKVDE